LSIFFLVDIFSCDYLERKEGHDDLWYGESKWNALQYCIVQLSYKIVPDHVKRTVGVVIGLLSKAKDDTKPISVDLNLLDQEEKSFLDTVLLSNLGDLTLPVLSYMTDL